jgi:hypothetical protein
MSAAGVKLQPMRKIMQMRLSPFMAIVVRASWL